MALVSTSAVPVLAITGTIFIVVITGREKKIAAAYEQAGAQAE